MLNDADVTEADSERKDKETERGRREDVDRMERMERIGKNWGKRKQGEGE
jgi:hypothetical protein